MISFVLKTSPNDDVNQPNEMRRFEELSPFPSLSMLFTKTSEKGLRRPANHLNRTTLNSRALRSEAEQVR